MKTMPCVIKVKSGGPKWHPGPPGGREIIKEGERERKRGREMKTKEREEERR